MVLIGTWNPRGGMDWGWGENSPRRGDGKWGWDKEEMRGRGVGRHSLPALAPGGCHP